MRTTLALLIATALFVPELTTGSSAAAAELLANVKLSQSYGVPVGDSPRYIGVGVVAEVGIEVGEMHGLVLRVRYASYPVTQNGFDWGTQSNISGGVGYSLRIPVAWRVQPYVGAHVGIGSWPKCVIGDSCGGLGPVAGGEIGGVFRLSHLVGIAFGVDTTVQFGMANDAGPVVQPGLFVGLRFGENQLR